MPESASSFVDKHLVLLLLIQLFYCPTCVAYAEKTFYFEVVEEQPVNTLIGKLPALDDHNYRISGNEESKRHIHLDLFNRTVQVKQQIDRENLKSDQLMLVLIHEENLSVTTVKIRVNDINDNNPQFASSFYNVSILETALLGTRISLPIAFDPDKAENGTIVSYQLQNPSSVFAIAAPSDNESVSLYLTGQLDHELQSLHEFVLLAFDGGQPSRHGQITVFVNVQDSNEAPRFEDRDYNVTATSKLEANSPLLKIKAIDNDSGYNGQIHYYIQNDPSDQFEIDSETGEVYTKPSVESLNCNQSSNQNTCLVTVEVVDGGSPPLKARKVVRLHVSSSNLHSPTITVKTYPTGQNYAFVNENSQSGTVIAVLTIKDSDLGLAGNVKLLIESGNEGNWFQLESGNNFGIIRIVRLESIVSKRFYKLVVRAQDEGTPSRFTRQTVKLIVYDDAATYKYLDETNNQTYVVCHGLPCYNGTCTLSGCQCLDDYSGSYCNKRTYSFKFGSYLRLPTQTKINSLSLQFRSASDNGLLLYSYSATNNFLAIELLNGELHAVRQVNDDRISTSLPLVQIDSYNLLTIKSNGSALTLFLNASPSPCSNTANCSAARAIGQDLSNHSIFIGGVSTPNLTGQLYHQQLFSPNFYGCMKTITIDEQPINGNLGVEEHALMTACPFSAKDTACSQLHARWACQGGSCVDSWEGFYCICGEGFETTNCRLENRSVSSANGRIHLETSRFSRQKLQYSRNNKLPIHKLDDKLFYSQQNFSCKNCWSQSAERIENWPSQWIEFDIRTSQPNATLLSVYAGRQVAVLNLVDGQLFYSLVDSSGFSHVSLYLNSTLVSDSNWHRITIEIASDTKSVRLQIDNQQLEKVMLTAFPQFLSSELDFIEVGSQSFYGCIRRLLLNNQLYSLLDDNALERQFFQIVSTDGSLKVGCSDAELCALSNDCPIEMFLYGITFRELIILIIILLVVVNCTVVGLRMRRRFRKQKRLANIQRISNLQLISTCDSDFAHDNPIYSSNSDFNYLPSYIPIYSNIIYPPNDIWTCHLKFDYEDSARNFVSNQYDPQNGVVAKFSPNETTDSQDCSISAASTDIP